MTNSVDLGGGEAKDVILDTSGIAPGTYVLYVTNLNHLSNNTEDFGGMMTEIIISPQLLTESPKVNMDNQKRLRLPKNKGLKSI